MLVIGERVGSGHMPLWLAAAAFELIAIVGTSALYFACRGPGQARVRRLGPRVGLTEDRLQRATAALERRGRPALLLGRTTPGLRTLTVMAAGCSGVQPRRALPALVLGSSVFLQLHLALGFFLGPAAKDALDRARGPALVVAGAALLGAAAFWVMRRRKGARAHAWGEAACPACLALNLVGERIAPGGLLRELG
jgi:membrane protein DedA with SNARE-associated domain